MSKARAEPKSNNHQESPWAWIEVKHQNQQRENADPPQPPRIYVAPHNWYLALGLICLYAGYTTGVVLNGWFSLFLA